MKQRIVSSFGALPRDDRANVAIMTAICALPLIGVMGLAVDYGILLSNKSALDAAADAGAIAAVTKAKAVLTGGGTMTDALAQGAAQAKAAFAANAGRVNYATSSDAIVPTVTWDPALPVQGQKLSVIVNYQMNSSSQFGKLFNKSTYGIGGSSKSSTVLTPYYQFIFVVDVSNSMAVGGTAADIAGLQRDSKIPNNCAFACHNTSGTDTRAIAKSDGWKLKIDYVNDAVQTFINGLSQQTKGVPGYFSVGIDTFGTGFNTLQVPIYPPAMALSAAKNIDVENADPKNNNGYTYTSTGLSSALAGITAIGDGSSIDKQATYVIFVSDGVEDTAKSGASWGRQTNLSYNAACTNIKKPGVTLITIEASYPSIPGDDQYAKLVAPLTSPNTPNMQTAMTQCATDATWAYQATDGPGINSAVSAILKRIMQGLTRITG